MADQLKKPAISVLLALAALAAALPLRSSSFAQQPGNPPVIVAIPDVFPDVDFPGAQQRDARGMILRAPGETDIVVLHPQHATPQALAAALNLLRQHRERFPAPERHTVVRITGFVAPEHRSSYAALAAKLAEFRRQPTSRIGNLGPGRWIEIQDPDLRP